MRLKEIPAPAEEVVEEQVEPIVEPIQKAKKVKAKKEKKVNVAAIAEHSNVEKVEQPKVENNSKSGRTTTRTICNRNI